MSYVCKLRKNAGYIYNFIEMRALSGPQDLSFMDSWISTWWI